MDSQIKDTPSAGYILAGLCSFIFPGLGQLLLNRIWSAIALFVIEMILWVFLINNSQDEAGFAFTILFILLVRFLSAYFAANGHKVKLEENSAIKKYNNLQSTGSVSGKLNYSEYLKQCQASDVEPLSQEDYEQVS